MSKIFILEDDPLRIRQFRQAAIGSDCTVATSYDEAVAKFAPPYDLICLDHDLGDRIMVSSTDPNTGYHFVEWFLQQRFANQMPIIVHSFNPSGARYMTETLNRRGYLAHQVLFGPKVLHIVSTVAAQAQIPLV